MAQLRTLADEILDLFESVLEENDISIPDEYRTGEETEARLYGETYYWLEDQITELIEQTITSTSVDAEG